MYVCVYVCVWNCRCIPGKMGWTVNGFELYDQHKKIIRYTAKPPYNTTHYEIISVAGPWHVARMEWMRDNSGMCGVLGECKQFRRSENWEVKPCLVYLLHCTIFISCLDCNSTSATQLYYCSIYCMVRATKNLPDLSVCLGLHVAHRCHSFQIGPDGIIYRLYLSKAKCLSS